MAQSPEYPDLLWMPPRAWASGRDGKAVRYIVVHYTAGSEGPTSAENGAAYDQRRTDGTSCHYHVDSNSVVQCVQTKDRANSALHKGNRLGIQYELAGTAQTRAQWLDPVSDATITNAARQMARDAVKYGIPIRRLSVAETRAAWYSFPAGPKGFVGHVDCTNAYPEDGGDHTDPGSQFPWDVLLSRVQQFISPQEEDMALDDLERAWVQNAQEYARTLARWTDQTLGPISDATASTPDSPQVNVFKLRFEALASDVAEIKARPPVASAPIDVATLKAALLDPEIQAVLVEAARQGAEAAEDS